MPIVNAAGSTVSISDLFMGKPKLLTFWQVRILYSAFKFFFNFCWLEFLTSWGELLLSSSGNRRGIHGFFCLHEALDLRVLRIIIGRVSWNH